MSKVLDLKKKLSAMKIKGSKAITLDVDYISELVDEIEKLENQEIQKVIDDDENTYKKNEKIVLHGGKFK